MAVPHSFPPVKLVAGLIFSGEEARGRAEKELRALFGAIEARSPVLNFDLTDYYAREMGPQPLKRAFISFETLISPEELPGIKLRTIALEEKIRLALGADARPVNIDPGYLTKAALIMATAKDFSHRVPLRDGIYAHLELLFTKTGVRTLDWTYPDLKRVEYHDFFRSVRALYLEQLKEKRD
ncbi:MAG: hypothetical protein A2Y56_09160 [Candidatus Aminicenantes bacterium RBG_13_63_10]|nr:MAG: hypothetical protein A2Y56_09160 [Candidatus Aminicenantes bacterium RBG_13_63_10]